MDDPGRRTRHALAGLAAGALLVSLLAASFLVARWAGSRVDLEEGLRLVGSVDAEERLLGLAKLRGNPEAAPVFGRLLDDADARVRLTAALMLAGAAGLDASAATDASGPGGVGLVERMRVWWRLEGRARYGGE